MCRYGGLFQAGVCGYEANLIGADSLSSRQRNFQLLGELRRLGFSGGKRQSESREFFLGHRGEELNASQPCRGQQLRELLFSGGAFQGHAVQQELGTRGSQEEAAIRPRRDSGMQLVKSNPKLFDGAGMFVAVQAGVLQQDVQASYEGASGRCFWI